MEKNIPSRVDRQLNRGIPKDFDTKEIRPNGILDPTSTLPIISNDEIIEAYKIVFDRFDAAEKVIGNELSHITIPISEFTPDIQTCISNLFGPQKLEIKFGDYKRLLQYCADIGTEVAEEELVKEGVV